ncbi:MAG: sulfur carrier protein ThiS [Polyangiales bacterium]
MQVTVNGEEHHLSPDMTIATLLTALGLSETPVAVERNQAVVPKTQHASTRLHEGDVLEVVHFVGGG